MKGINHLFISIFISIFIFLSKVFSSISSEILFVGLFFFILGSLLPDSDSKDNGSLIYVFVPISLRKSYRKQSEWEKFSKFLLFIFGIIICPIAFITHKLEKLLIIYTKRPQGHKQSLHTIFGIFMTSLFWSLVFYLIIKISLGNINFATFFFWFFCLFISQLLHLIEDLIVEKKGWKISWKGKSL
jgi:hypothetical protein